MVRSWGRGANCVSVASAFRRKAVAVGESMDRLTQPFRLKPEATLTQSYFFSPAGVGFRPPDVAVTAILAPMGVSGLAPEGGSYSKARFSMLWSRAS
jgi:hypothetical protein